MINSKVWLGRFYGVLAVFAAVAAALSYYFLSPRGALLCLLGALLLGAGFKLTELIVGVLTKTRSANATAMGLVVVFKLGWWVLVFWLAQQVKGPDSWGIAAGFGAFLAAILIQGIFLVGPPKLSSHNKDS